jgi:hypothetical protein
MRVAQERCLAVEEVAIGAVADIAYPHRLTGAKRFALPIPTLAAPSMPARGSQPTAASADQPRPRCQAAAEHQRAFRDA